MYGYKNLTLSDVLRQRAPLPSAKMLLKTGTCPVSTCTVAAVDLVYRHEQKIVDTMLTCDLIYSTHLSYDCVILVSGGRRLFTTSPNSPSARNSRRKV